MVSIAQDVLYESSYSDVYEIPISASQNAEGYVINIEGDSLNCTLAGDELNCIPSRPPVHGGWCPASGTGWQMALAVRWNQ